MGKIEDLKDQAIVVVYPDGTIEQCPITFEVVHFYYMLDLQEESEKFADALEKSHVDLRYEGEIPPTLFTTGFDYALAKEQGVIVFHNLELSSINNNPDGLPYFSITMPNTLTDEQRETMTSIEEDNNLSGCSFGVPGDDGFVDVQYEDAKKIYSKQRAK